MPDLLTDEVRGPQGAAAATFSPDRRYRYLLTRCWDMTLPPINFLMLNPSTADSLTLDPTVKRCLGRAQALGYGNVIVTNLFAYRATDPEQMRRTDDPIGPRNDEAILLAARMSALTVCGWGNHGVFAGRQAVVLGMLRGNGVRLRRIGPPNKNGTPKHPLYIRSDATLETHS